MPGDPVDPGCPVDPGYPGGRGGLDFLTSRGRKLWGWGVYGVFGLCFTSLSYCAFYLFSYLPVFTLGHTLYKYLCVSGNFPSVEKFYLTSGGLMFIFCC